MKVFIVQTLRSHSVYNFLFVEIFLENLLLLRKTDDTMKSINKLKLKHKINIPLFFRDPHLNFKVSGKD